jgi:hypothetical protein
MKIRKIVIDVLKDFKAISSWRREISKGVDCRFEWIEGGFGVLSFLRQHLLCRW